MYIVVHRGNYSVLEFLLALICLCGGTPLVAAAADQQQSQSQLVLQQSILTRAIAIEAPNKLVGLLNTMPTGLVPRDAKSSKARSALWSLFFSGSMTRLARLPSPQPFIAFYNPFADVAIVQGCKVDPTTRVMLCAQACAVPGEVLAGEPVSSTPAWLLSSDPIDALQRIAGARMRAFGDAQPASSPETAFWRRLYCSADHQNAAEKRVISLASTLARLDARQFDAAAIRYVTNAIKISAAQHSQTEKPDAVVVLLANLNALALSGGVLRPNHGWLIFLTSKTNGWRVAALIVTTEANGALRIESARFLNMSTR